MKNDEEFFQTKNIVYMNFKPHSYGLKKSKVHKEMDL